jgi:hypothetical protein
MLRTVLPLTASDIHSDKDNLPINPRYVILLLQHSADILETTDNSASGGRMDSRAAYGTCFYWRDALQYFTPI